MMKWILGLVLALMAAAQVVAAKPASYANPVIYADYSDPDVIRVGKSYYMVSSSFHFSPGIPVMTSRDLVHWMIVGHVLPKLNFAPEYNMVPPFGIDDATSKPVTGTRYGGGVWAPAIRFHDGLFYVYWPKPDEGIFMATAKDAAGPWSAPVAVMTQAGLEDPCPFWDEDGQAWLVHGKVGAGPLILHRLGADGTSVLDDGQVIAEDKAKLPYLEGPKLYKRHGWYYIFAPFGGVETGSEAVLRSRSIQGPYETRVVLSQGTTTVQGPHQGGYVEGADGNGWFLHFNSTGAFGRIDYLEPVRWVDDWPVVGDNGQPVSRYAMPGVAHAEDRLQASDEFSGKALGLQWEWNHNPDDGHWSLSERPGFLRLKAGQAEHLVTARNTLTQILHGPGETVTTQLDISGMVDGQRAGLVLFGVKPPWIGVVRTDGMMRLTTASAGVETPGPIVREGVVLLRAEVTSDQRVRFSYSIDGKGFTALGEPVLLAKFSWWKGSRPGLFTYGAVNGGWVDVDWFHVAVTP